MLEALDGLTGSNIILSRRECAGVLDVGLIRRARLVWLRMMELMVGILPSLLRLQRWRLRKDLLRMRRVVLLMRGGPVVLHGLLLVASRGRMHVLEMRRGVKVGRVQVLPWHLRNDHVRRRILLSLLRRVLWWMERLRLRRITISRVARVSILHVAVRILLHIASHILLRLMGFMLIRAFLVGDGNASAEGVRSHFPRVGPAGPAMRRSDRRPHRISRHRRISSTCNLGSDKTIN